MERNYVPIPFSYLEEMSPLSDAEFGRLVRALIKWAETGATPDLTGSERFLWPVAVRRDNQFRESFEKVDNQRRAAGKKSSEHKRANESQREPTKVNETQRSPTNLNEGQREPTKVNENDNINNKSNTNIKTNININPSIPLPPSSPDGAQKGQRWDGWMDYADAKAYFEQRFDLPHADERCGELAPAVQSMASLLAEVVSDPSPTVQVGSQPVPKGRFLQLTADHAAYVAESVAAQEGKIRNPRSYLLTALYRAPDTMGLRNSQSKQAKGKKTAEQQARDAAAAAKQTEWMLNFLADLKQDKGGETA